MSYIYGYVSNGSKQDPDRGGGGASHSCLPHGDHRVWNQVSGNGQRERGVGLGSGSGEMGGRGGGWDRVAAAGMVTREVVCWESERACTDQKTSALFHAGQMV